MKLTRCTSGNMRKISIQTRIISIKKTNKSNYFEYPYFPSQKENHWTVEVPVNVFKSPRLSRGSKFSQVESVDSRTSWTLTVILSSERRKRGGIIITIIIKNKEIKTQACIFSACDTEKHAGQRAVHGSRHVKGWRVIWGHEDVIFPETFWNHNKALKREDVKIIKSKKLHKRKKTHNNNKGDL